MANISCNSCESLRQAAPNFVINGLGSAECTSLKNNTGLDPSSGHKDCADLEDMNDCLVGNMEKEVDAHSCDWKKFAKQFIGNLWTTLKGIICAICGLWTHVEGLEDKTDNLCVLIDSVLAPPLSRYGILPNKYGQDHPDNRGGVIASKGGSPVLVAMEQSELSELSWNQQNVGIYHGLQRVRACSTNTCQIMEWIAPNLIGYKVRPDLTLDEGDLLWSCSVAELRAWGMTEDMIHGYTISSWIWFNYGISGNPRGAVWIKLAIDDGRMRMTYEGKVGADQLTANRRIMEDSNPAKLYRYGC